MNFLVAVLAMVAIHALWGMSGQWLEQRLNLLSMAPVAIGGSGAFAYAHVLSHGGSGVAALAVSTLLGCLLGGAITLLAERVVGDAFVLLTFSLHLAWLSVARVSPSLTGGALGTVVSGTPSGSANVPPGLEVLVWCILLATAMAILGARIDRGPFAVTLAVTARSAELVRTQGGSSFLTFLQSGVLTGGVAGYAGALFAAYCAFVSPDQLGLDKLILVTCIAVAGSGARLLVVAAIVLGLPEGLRLLGVSGSQPAHIQSAFAGLVLVVLTLRQSRSRAH